MINFELHSCQLGPRYEGQLTRMAEPIPPSGQSSSYSLTTLSSSSSTDRRAETDRKVITTRIAVAHHFICRLRRRESCILGATSSQPTLPLHELPPARLVIHRQTSNQGDAECSIEVGHISGFLPPATLAVDNGRAPHYGARHEEAVAKEGGRYTPVRRVLGSEPLRLRTHRHCGRSRPLRSAVVENQVPSVTV